MANESKPGESKSGESKPKNAKPGYDPAKRANAPKALGVALGRLTKPVFKQRGIALAEIINRWAEITGPLLYAETQPEKLVYAAGAGHAATLEIAVSPAFALELQHLAPLIIEKINGYFGYRAVERLRLRQMPIQRSGGRAESSAPPRRQSRPLDPEEQARLAALLEGVEDKALRQALENLGRSLFGASR
ncbi:DUF721 domain-containing protein [Ferrovibrio sp.]|uniref:DUF721 domain-containing protein n=1 Tax=Ferrovibrio sp. TaxID=1917215 RepID=UPI00261DF298|nr:DciA family protein [Ferrovibrio sp.]